MPLVRTCQGPGCLWVAPDTGPTVLSARESIVRPAKSLSNTPMLACSPLTCNTQTVVRGEALSQVALMTHL